MEFQDVVRRRRMVRRYDPDRPVPPEVVDRILHNAVRAPSAGFSQGWGFLVLDTPEDIDRFRTACRHEEWPDDYLAATVRAPLLIVVHSNKDVYLDRYAQADKGFTDRDDSWWPAPYWDIDAGMAALLILQTAVDAGLGACFFGLPKERIPVYRKAFGVPDAFHPIGAVSIGYPDDPLDDDRRARFRARRKPATDVIHRGRWST
ncbi:MAG TPA: nitroreductase family protein [Actinophytocola sp.]|uniref:nitroreductase family protein n=1 Tax=Actinophytocola sp. TaxID=1872138 RepID=UPI002DDCB6E1|nr:nitroreductase family protein [Actinophytocola sp.]HEV2780088.1 nitroreductase family protein [Actinophytocola sp.]